MTAKYNPKLHCVGKNLSTTVNYGFNYIWDSFFNSSTSRVRSHSSSKLLTVSTAFGDQSFLFTYKKWRYNIILIDHLNSVSKFLANKQVQFLECTNIRRQPKIVYSHEDITSVTACHGKVLWLIYYICPIFQLIPFLFKN